MGIKAKFYLRLKMTAGVVCAAVCVSLLVIAASSLPAQAEDVMPMSATDAVSVEIETACSFNAVGMDSHNARLTLGATTSEIGKTTFNAVCNDGNGWAVYAVGYTGDTEGDNKLRQAGTSYSIDSGDGTDGDISQWAMKLTAVGDEFVPTVKYAGDYDTVPSVSKKVIYYPGATGSAGSSFESTYRVYVPYTQASGVYTGQVRYTMVHPNDPEDITELHYMQDMNATVCRKTQVGVSAQLEDSRDHKLYWVTKLPDGNCWMTQNLDLDLNESTLPLTSATSDVASSWTPGNEYYTRTSITNSTDNNATYSWDLGDYQYDGTTNNSCGTGAHSFADCLTGHGISASLATDSPEAKDNPALHYHVGNFYQWPTATAGSGKSITSGNASASLCPQGWHLPHNSGNPSFLNLKNSTAPYPDMPLATVQDWLNPPYYFVRSGYINSGTLQNVGYASYAWSGTGISATNAYYLVMNDVSIIYPQNNTYRYYGRPVRCVATS